MDYVFSLTDRHLHIKKNLFIYLSEYPAASVNQIAASGANVLYVNNSIETLLKCQIDSWFFRQGMSSKDDEHILVFPLGLGTELDKRVKKKQKEKLQC